jgi:tetratricopeptide (TPR) repeat protein
MPANTPPRSPGPSWIPGLFYALLGIAVALAGIRADPRTWGVHAFAFLPRMAWILATIGLAVLLLPSVAERTGRIAAWVGERLSRSILVVVVALGAAVLFYLWRLEFQFLGDGMVWVGAIADGKRFYHFEPLAAAMTQGLANLLTSAHPERAGGALSILMGALYVLTTAGLCRTLWPDAGTRGLAWLLLVIHPVLLLFFGYIESYPVLVALEVCFVLALAAMAKGRLAWPTAAVVLGFAIATHVVAIAWLPALVVLVHALGASKAGARAHTGSLRRSLRAASAVVIALAVAFASAVVIGVKPARLVADLFGHNALGSQSWAWMFSLRHAADLGNEFMLLLSPAWVLLAAALAGSLAPAAARKREADSEVPNSFWQAMAMLGLGTLAVTLFVQPRIGGARDWDLFTPVVLPAILLVVHSWRAWQRQPTRALADAGRALGLAIVCTGAWLAVGLDAGRSAWRLEVLQQPHGSFSKFARGYANETLGIYYRSRDPEAARLAWVRAAQANPANPRYFNNLGMEELRRNDLPAACVAFRRALELGMDEYFVRYNVANCERKEGDLAAAEELYDTLIEQARERWEAFGARGLVRVQRGRAAEGLQDLQIAARLAPNHADVFYSMGLALEALGRMDEARAAWQRALQIDPKHAASRQRLSAYASPQ